MRAALRYRAAVTAAGVAALAGAAFALRDVPLGSLALLAAAAILCELLEGDRSRAREPVSEQRLQLASAVHVASVIVVGVAAATVVAAVGALAPRLFRGGSWRVATFRGAAFALATGAGGIAFHVAGGHVGTLTLAHDVAPVLTLGVAYLTARIILLELVAAREIFQPDLAAGAAETGFGVAIALLAQRHGWDVLALVPVALALERAHSRLAQLRRETLRALETFANIVDERDPSTYRHSLRVAGHVDALARALKFPFSDIDRLRWAARLHDLGKVAVDAAVLAKPGTLDGAEWAAVRRYPRLSARLLQRFHFTAGEARAVEYHHERFDGSGYYGVQPDDLPLASHFLIVADAFDAMTADRPYRPGLSRGEALEEIERNIGTQFHPGIAKAFVALQRGEDPLAALEPAELEELRAAATSYRLPAVPGARDLRERPELVGIGGLLVALAGLGLAQPALAAAGGAVAALGLGLGGLVRTRAERLAASFREVLGRNATRDAAVDALLYRLDRALPIRWGAYVAWREDGLGGAIELARGEGPPEAGVVGWLVREAESGADLIAAAGAELGRDGLLLALPLRRDNSALIGFLVVEAERTLPRHVERALRACLDEIGLGLADRVSSDRDGRERPETLDAGADPRPLRLVRGDER